MALDSTGKGESQQILTLAGVLCVDGCPSLPLAVPEPYQRLHALEYYNDRLLSDINDVQQGQIGTTPFYRVWFPMPRSLFLCTYGQERGDWCGS